MSPGGPSPSCPNPTMAAKVRVRARGRGKVRTTALTAPTTIAATIAGAPQCGPPSTIPGPTSPRCGQGCVLHSSSRRATTTRPARCTGILWGSRRSLLCAPAGSSIAPTASHGSCLVALDGHMGSAVIGKLLQHHDLDSLAVTDWVADFGVSNHTTSDVSNLTSVRPPTFIDPSSIVVSNGSALLVISAGDPALLGLFYINNVLVTPDIIQNLLSVRHFTTNDWCSMKFDMFDLSVKDLSTRNMIARCNSSEPLYMMHLPSHLAPSSSTSTLSALVASTSTWHRHLSHPGVNVLSKLSHDSSVVCSRHSHDLCHACQLGCHIRLPFVGSNSCVDNNFD
jgi:hypothetical protein